MPTIPDGVDVVAGRADAARLDSPPRLIVDALARFPLRALAQRRSAQRHKFGPSLAAGIPRLLETARPYARVAR